MNNNPNRNQQQSSMEQNLVIMVYAIYYLARKVFRSHRKERHISEYICVALKKKYNSIPNKDDFIINLVNNIQSQGMTEKELLSKLLELTFEMGEPQREKILSIAENLVTFAHGQELNRIHDAFNIERKISYQIKSSVMSGITENAGIRGIIMAILTVTFTIIAITMPIVGILLDDDEAIPAVSLIHTTANTTDEQARNAIYPVLQRIEFDKFIINGVLSQDNIASATTNSSVYNVQGYADISIDLTEFSYLNSVVSHKSDLNLIPFRIKVTIHNATLVKVGFAQSYIEPNTGKAANALPMQTFTTADGWLRLQPKKIHTQPVGTQNNSNLTTLGENIDNAVYTPTEPLFYQISDHSKIIHYLAPTPIPMPDINTVADTVADNNTTEQNTMLANPVTPETNYLIINTILSSEHNSSPTIDVNRLDEQIAISLLSDGQIYSTMVDTLKIFLYTEYARNNLYVSTINLNP